MQSARGDTLKGRPVKGEKGDIRTDCNEETRPWLSLWGGRSRFRLPVYRHLEDSLGESLAGLGEELR